MLWLPLVSLVAVEQGEVAQASVAVSASSQPVVRISPQADPDDPVRVDDVEVVGRRGAALVPPETVLDGAEIDALGAWDISEVLGRLTETMGVADEPLVIINGKRVPNPSAFTGFPPDALVRAEVLPPEAAALYGGTPGQRVVNLVLQRQFASYDGRLNASRPTAGGTSTVGGDLRRSAIAGQNTRQMGLRLSRDTALRAWERDRDLPGQGPDAGGVTLRPRTDTVSANLNLTRGLGDWSGVFSLNGQARDSRSSAERGGVLIDSRRRMESLGASAGASGLLIGWSLQANLNANASRSRDDGFTDRRSENQSLGLMLSANRSLLNLPAGAVVANLNSSLQSSRSTTRTGQDDRTTRFQSSDFRGSLAVPLSKAGAENGVGHLLGDVLLTLGGSLRETGSGGGNEVNASLAWTPLKGVNLNALWSTSTEAVPEQQRSEPAYDGDPRVVFDFRNGEAVEIIPLLGGNPDLRPPSSERLSLTASLGPFTSWSLAANLGYQRAEATDGIGVLPDLTEEVEAAFPDRFVRDGSGRLISVDYRPLNLGSSLNEGLTAGLNFNLPRPAGGGAAANEAMVLRLALNYSLKLTDSLSLLPGRPETDRLRGDGGGTSRQSANLTLDARKGRWGVNASARWTEGYRSRRFSGRDDAGDLVTSDFASVDLRFSFQMTSSASRSGPRSGDAGQGGGRRRSQGMQLGLDISNLFDARPEARLGDGSPAPGFGRDDRDPLGRTVRLTLQRRF
ncbi:TonB-dependent receptor [Brevundimonas faecalis]|uniref:TonB-dependent receptor n=1 Tax=Brevundimonas faecalis TaxID=947378 RepID=A0ABV2R8R6_9CAUL